MRYSLVLNAKHYSALNRYDEPFRSSRFSGMHCRLLRNDMLLPGDVALTDDTRICPVPILRNNNRSSSRVSIANSDMLSTWS